jgi:hypothetical protein
MPCTIKTTSRESVKNNIQIIISKTRPSSVLVEVATSRRIKHETDFIKVSLSKVVTIFVLKKCVYSMDAAKKRNLLLVMDMLRGGARGVRAYHCKFATPQKTLIQNVI